MDQHDEYVKFASRIDWNRPEFNEAKRLWDKGAEEEAMHLVATHFRTRKVPLYLFDAKDAGACADPQVMVEAEQVMRHFIYGYQFPGDIDWSFNPTEGTSHDDEWSWSLYRTIYWQPLCRAYAKTHDEKYAGEFVKQMRSFVSAWPVEPFMEDEHYGDSYVFPGHAWRTIETGIRIYTTWLPCYEVFRSSPSFDDASLILFLDAIADHAEFLSTHFSNHKSSSNWLSMECTALLQTGVLFPEFTNAHAWYLLGYRRTMHEALYDFDENGIHMERTPVYHMVAAISFYQSWKLLTKNGLPVPSYLFPLVEKAAQYVMNLVKPDLTTPMVGDADREDLTTSRADVSLYEGMNLSFFPDDLNELRAFFREMGKVTGRKDFPYFASLRKEGRPPVRLDYNLHEGLYLMRSGWNADDSYLLLHGVRLERGEKSTHSHVDQCHVELQVRGEDVLVDCGRYIYNRSVWKDWRQYFTFQHAHNVLDVDGHQMGQVPGQTERMRGVRTYCHAFEKTDGYWLIDLSHNGYAYLDDPVFQRRQAVRLPGEVYVVVDAVTGLGEADHDFTLFFNFAPGKMERKQDGAYRYETKKGTAFHFAFSSDAHLDGTLLVGSEEPKGGWISYGYSLKEPAPQIMLSRHGKTPFKVVSVIAPDGIVPEVTVGKSVMVRYGSHQAMISDAGVEVTE